MAVHSTEHVRNDARSRLLCLVRLSLHAGVESRGQLLRRTAQPDAVPRDAAREFEQRNGEFFPLIQLITLVCVVLGSVSCGHRMFPHFRLLAVPRGRDRAAAGLRGHRVLFDAPREQVRPVDSALSERRRLLRATHGGGRLRACTGDSAGLHRVVAVRVRRNESDGRRVGAL